MLIRKGQKFKCDLGRLRMYLKFRQCLIGFHLLFSTNLLAEGSIGIQAPYNEIKDIYHPTNEDYRLIQNYLKNGKREEISRMGDFNYEHVARSLKIIGDTPEEIPRQELIHVNCSGDEKNNCLIAYSTFNRNYPKALERLVNIVKNSDYTGDILYRLGGWPNEEGGSLILAHVPYAFKVSYFKEAQRMGYKRVFWLDTAVCPLVSLNEIFKIIQDKGYFIMGCAPHTVGQFCNETAVAAFGLSLNETEQIPFCSAGIFGVDFTNEKGAKIIDLLYKAAHDKDAFFSSRSDQAALSIILYQMGIADFVSIERMPHHRNEIKSDSLLLLDREFAHFGH